MTHMIFIYFFEYKLYYFYFFLKIQIDHIFSFKSPMIMCKVFKTVCRGDSNFSWTFFSYYSFNLISVLDINFSTGFQCLALTFQPALAFLAWTLKVLSSSSSPLQTSATSSSHPALLASRENQPTLIIYDDEWRNQKPLLIEVVNRLWPTKNSA